MSETISKASVCEILSDIYPTDGEKVVTVKEVDKAYEAIQQLPSVQPEPREVVPHRNYQYLSDYWCQCGWHLGKKGDVKYCPDCGRKVIWDE